MLASLIGTTGAAMLLIRLLLETNRERKHVRHTVVFFIFIVCNCGGCLLPLGDPPLLLGYLMGVPFLWTMVLWKEWLFVNAALLAIYYLWDRFWCYPHERPADVARDETPRPPAAVRRPLAQRRAAVRRGSCRWRCWIPASRCPAPAGIPGCYLREAVQLALVALSLVLGSRPRAAGQPLQLRRDRGSRRAVLRHLHLYAAAAGNPPASRGRSWGSAQPWHYFWAAGEPVVGARQRPHLRGIL